MIRAIWDAVLYVYDLGGSVVLVLGAMSLAVVAVVLYKLWQFRAAGLGRHRALSEAVAAWDAGNAEAARTALAQSRSYLAPVIDLAMAGRVDAPRLEAEAQTRFGRLERGFRLLDTAAQLAPLLGLFGTVLGMIAAFQASQEAGAQVDPSILAGGIWVALLTTAVGLVVAMPTAAILSWFEARMEAERLLAERALRTVLAPVSAPVVAPGAALSGGLDLA